MKDESWLPGVNEPLEEYMKSDRFRKSSAGITFSDFHGQEEANYAYWRHLSPAQRLELHTIMVGSLFKNEFIRNTGNQVFEIVFTTKSI